MLRRVTASMGRSRPFAWMVALLERLDVEAPDLLRVLTYHRVESPAAGHPPGLSVAPAAFEEQMRYLRARYHVVAVDDVLHALRARTSLPRRSVLITFDDGYRDFRVNAWPVLRALGLPAVLFVPTAFPGDPAMGFWWDQLHHALTTSPRREPLETTIGRLPLATVQDRMCAYARLRARAKQMPHAEALDWTASICRELAVASPPAPILSWDELRELDRDGVRMGSHTRTHPLLTRIPIEQARTEVRASLDDLKRELGAALPILAYPAGAFDDGVVRMLADEGFALAFTTVRGTNALRTAHPLKLRRISIGQRTSLPLMRAQLTGWSRALNGFHPLRAPGEGSI